MKQEKEESRLFLFHIFLKLPARKKERTKKSWMNEYLKSSWSQTGERRKNKPESSSRGGCKQSGNEELKIACKDPQSSFYLVALLFSAFIEKLISWFPELLNSFRPKATRQKRLVTDWERLNDEFKIVENCAAARENQ